MIETEDFIQSYRKHTKTLYGYVSRRVGGERSLAEDIVQETWMRAVQHWSRRSMPEQPQSWLRTVARNLLASHFRRRRPVALDPTDIDLADDRFHPETPRAAALVNWGLARMRRRQVELLEAFHFEGKSIREIAEESGLSERAVEGRLRRARDILKRRLLPFVSETARAGVGKLKGSMENEQQT